MTVFQSDYKPAQAAGDRLTGFMGAVGTPVAAGVTMGDHDDVRTAIAMHTQVPVRTYQQIEQQILRNATQSPVVEPRGFLVVPFMLGWLIRDEQQKLNEGGVEQHDAPATCDAGQAALRASGHKFCPDCGIVRALHREFSDGDDCGVDHA